MNEKTKQKKQGKPVQVYLEEGIKVDFARMVAEYDAGLGMAGAVRKLIIQALQDHWIPGYIKREKIREGGEPMGDIAGKNPLISKPIRGRINQ